MLVSRITINFWFRCSNWNKSNINIIFFQKHGTACTSWNRSDQLHVCGRCFDFHTTVRSHRSDILLNSSRPGSSPLLHFFSCSPSTSLHLSGVSPKTLFSDCFRMCERARVKSKSLFSHLHWQTHKKHLAYVFSIHNNVVFLFVSLICDFARNGSALNDCFVNIFV